MPEQTLPVGLTLLNSTAQVAFDCLGDFWILLPTSTRWVNLGVLERLALVDEQAKTGERKRIVDLIRAEYNNSEFDELGSFEFTENIIDFIEAQGE